MHNIEALGAVACTYLDIYWNQCLENMHVFSQKIIDDWNSSTENIVISESLDILKCKHDKYWSTEWLRKIY